MKTTATLLLSCALAASAAGESELKKAFKKTQNQPEESNETALKNHIIGSNEVADQQDELAADVQELLQEETNEKVIDLLSEVEGLMAQTTENLTNADTSAETIAIPNEIIEKIMAAARERKSSSSKSANDPLLQMMENMLGNPQGKSPSDQSGEQSGPNAGEGSEGDSATPNLSSSGASNGSKEVRRLTKNSGSSGTPLPKEFRKALEAYNKAQNAR